MLRRVVFVRGARLGLPLAAPQGSFGSHGLMGVLLRYMLAAIAFGIAALGFILLPVEAGHTAEEAARSYANGG